MNGPPCIAISPAMMSRRALQAVLKIKDALVKDFFTLKMRSPHKVIKLRTAIVLYKGNGKVSNKHFYKQMASNTGIAALELLAPFCVP